MMLQVRTENGQAIFAVIPFAVFEELRALLADEEKLADYLDDLHMQKVKEQQAHGRGYFEAAVTAVTCARMVLTRACIARA